MHNTLIYNSILLSGNLTTKHTNYDYTGGICNNHSQFEIPKTIIHWLHQAFRWVWALPHGTQYQEARNPLPFCSAIELRRKYFPLNNWLMKDFTQQTYRHNKISLKKIMRFYPCSRLQFDWKNNNYILNKSNFGLF